MPVSDDRGAAGFFKMSDTNGAREALTKSSFTFHSTNPKDDIQIKRLTLRMAEYKKLITSNIKKAEDTHDGIIKLKSQEGITENCRIKAGMVLTGVAYLDAAQKEIINLSEANVFFSEMMSELALTVPDLEEECNEKI